MKTPPASCLLLVGLVLGFALATAVDHPAVAQNPAAAATGRYQVSAYAAASGVASFGHGCYIIDTATGETWHAMAGHKREPVAGPVR